MEVDGRTLDVAALDADVCIVGAGPAGLTVACALLSHGWRVVMLESGGRQPERDAQALCDGRTTGDPYAGLGATRHRQAGGTTQIWNTWLGGEYGAKYVPLDAIDFEAREYLPMSGWPFGKAELEPYYEQAHRLCGLGPYRYRAADWLTPERQPLPLLPGPLTTAVYQFGSAQVFTRTSLEEIRRAGNALLCLHVTATGLETDRDVRCITSLRAMRGMGKPLDIRARLFVLAAGGIENARLLLLPTASSAGGLGNESGLVGRCFMEHPRDMSCRLVRVSAHLRDQCRFYEMHQAPGGLIMGRLTFTEEARRHQQLPGMSITLQARPSRLPRKARRFEAFDLRINVEQAPDPDNRVFLDTERDRLGLPRAAMHWRWRERDREGLDRVRSVLVGELERAGLGRVVVDRGAAIDPNAHHHMGTTRMHRDPRRGVANENARVHGLSNLFVIGSSLFPTGGFANPTLTIVALALRLADHLTRKLPVAGVP